jgi:hypothetical protein
VRDGAEEAFVVGYAFDAKGKVVDAVHNPTGVVQFKDTDDDATSLTTRIWPIPGCARCRTAARPAGSTSTRS